MYSYYQSQPISILEVLELPSRSAISIDFADFKIILATT